MTSLKQMILNNWKTDIVGNLQIIDLLKNTAYPAWTVKYDDSFGVAIPFDSTYEINETFAGARIRSTYITDSHGIIQRVLVLLTDNDDIKTPFSSLCEGFVDPGENGSVRKQIEESALSWWQEWKELLGNRNIDSRIYDTLGELYALKYAIEKGEDAYWNGPDGKSYDIETEDKFIEVKSSTVKSKRQITISNRFQLYPHKPLFIIYCLFEATVMTGISIDSVLEELEQLGVNTRLINAKLESKGFEQWMSSRKKTFIPLEIRLYEVGPDFPQITNNSFVNGALPDGVVDITYTVDLTNQPSTIIHREESQENDIQND